MKPTVQDALAEAHGLMIAMDLMRPTVPADRLEAFDRDYADAMALRDALVVTAIGSGLRRRRNATYGTNLPQPSLCASQLT